MAALKISLGRWGKTRKEVVLSSMLSLGVTAMQQLGLLSQMSIEWTDPLRSFLRAFLVMNLNVEFVHVDCVSSMSPMLSAPSPSDGRLPAMVCGWWGVGG